MSNCIKKIYFPIKVPYLKLDFLGEMTSGNKRLVLTCYITHLKIKNYFLWTIIISEGFISFVTEDKVLFII